MLDDRLPVQPQDGQRRPVGRFGFAARDRRAAVFFAAAPRTVRCAEPVFFFADEPGLFRLDPALGLSFLAAGLDRPEDTGRVVRAALRAFASLRITSGSSRSRHMYQDATEAYGAQASPIRITSFGVGSFGSRYAC